MAETLEEFTKETNYKFDKLLMVARLEEDFWKLSEAPAITAEMTWDGLCSLLMRWSTARRFLLTYRWPTTWRDAFKDRWFPGWLKTRWPVQYTKISLTEVAAIEKSQPKGIPLRYWLDMKHETP